MLTPTLFILVEWLRLPLLLAVAPSKQVFLKKKSKRADTLG